MRMTYIEAVQRYGVIVGGTWANETKWCAPLAIPEGITLTNQVTGKIMKSIYCNRDMHGGLLHALLNVLDRGCSEELKTFDGCLMIRDVRAKPGYLSTHAYALAIDLNAQQNRLGAKPMLSQKLVECFTDAGFTWGGDFFRQDGMHFSYAWE